MPRLTDGGARHPTSGAASKEDDPLVATPFAAGALGICRTFRVR